MKKILLLIGILMTFEPAMAVDSQAFCEFLLARASVDGASKVQGQDAMAKVTALMEIHKMLNDFLSLAKTGVDQKMSWDSFKKYASTKGSTFSDYYQPQYDKIYMDKYCGKAMTESEVDVKKNGSTVKSSSKTTFQLQPNPQEHEYSKQINGAK